MPSLVEELVLAAASGKIVASKYVGMGESDLIRSASSIKCRDGSRLFSEAKVAQARTIASQKIPVIKPIMTRMEEDGMNCKPLAFRKSRAIITVAIDDHLRVLDVTRPLMKAYAERVGAELIEITDNHYHQWPMGNKWRVRNYAWYYERTLFVDSDVLIMPTAPNIFEKETAPICVRDEQDDYRGREGWNDRELDAMFSSQGIASHKFQKFSNGGVILMNYETAQLYKEPELPCPRTWCLDQHWLQYRIESSGVEVGWLDDRWNWGFIRPDFFTGLRDAWFVHLNGSRGLDYRVELAKHISSGNFSFLAPPNDIGWIPMHVRT